MWSSAGFLGFHDLKAYMSNTAVRNSSGIHPSLLPPLSFTQGVAGALEHPSISVSVVERCPTVARAVVSGAVTAFDSNLWNPVSLVLTQVCVGCAVKNEGWGMDLGRRETHTLCSRFR